MFTDKGDNNIDVWTILGSVVLCCELFLYCDALTGGHGYAAIKTAIEKSRERRAILASLDAEQLANEADCYLRWYDRRHKLRGEK